jgi:NADH-quinone oxidoreductase subunit G
VRFGQEIAGQMEFGMLNRGEHAEITTFVDKTVNSELSGNMIDLCPVGALTSKPFRYSARTWELSRRKSVSPHDSLGSNLIVQVKGSKVMRVLPMENEAVNECWLSDRDRFSYEGLNSEDRLTVPMIKQGGQWQETDWQTALEYVAHGLKNIKHEHGADSIAALATPYSTLEELSLLQKMVRGLGSDNVDFRLRQSNFELDGKVTPWLGMSVTEFSESKRVFVIGSFLRKDHPLLASRLRQAVKRGAKVSVLHAADDDLLMPVANKVVAAPSSWLSVLNGIVAAIAQEKNIAAPVGFQAVEASAEAKQIAASLLSGESRAVVLGNAVAQHPQAAQLHVAAQWIAQNTDAKFGYLTEAANSVGGYLANATPGKGANALQAFAQPRKAYVLLHAEPEFDTYNPQVARAALDQAEMVVALSPFKHGADYADVLLPVAPFAETSGTFVSAEGRAQGFNGSVKPLGETRPAWKVLRVLGNLLGLSGFDYETSEAIRNEVLGTKDLAAADLTARLNNIANLPLQASAAAQNANGQLERLADVPIYFSDAIVRRAEALQKTVDAQAPKAWLSVALAQKLGVADGAQVKVKQGQGVAILTAAVDSKLPDSVVRVSTGHASTAALGAMFGAISVEKA